MEKAMLNSLVFLGFLGELVWLCDDSREGEGVADALPYRILGGHHQVFHRLAPADIMLFVN